jgi:hypothetical protein
MDRKRNWKARGGSSLDEWSEIKRRQFGWSCLSVHWIKSVSFIHSFIFFYSLPDLVALQFFIHHMGIACF